MYINSNEQYIEAILSITKKNSYLFLLILLLGGAFVDLTIKKVMLFVFLGFFEISLVVLLIFFFKEKIINFLNDKILKVKNESKLDLKTFQFSYIFPFSILFFSFILEERVFFELNISFFVLNLILYFFMKEIQPLWCNSLKGK